MNILVDIVSPKMNLSPISRESMRSLKAKKDEANRIKSVNEIITMIYRSVVSYAESRDITSFEWSITDHCKRTNGYCHPNPSHHGYQNYIFIISNTQSIIQGLESLFPGCSVDYKMMARSPDGKIYDVSNMDEGAKAFIGAGQIQEYIVIDWS